MNLKDFAGMGISGKLKGGILYWLLTLLVLVIYVQNPSSLQKTEYAIEDRIRSAKPLEPDKANIAIVAIDSRSIEQVGKWPWDHSRLSDLLITICDYKPRAVLLDLPLTEKVKEYVKGRSGQLAQSMADCGDVVLPFDIVISTSTRLSRPAPDYLQPFSQIPPSDMSVDELPHVTVAFVPPQLFVAKLRAVGFSHYEPDLDDVVRSASLLAEFNERVYFSALLQFANVYLGHAPEDIQLSGGGRPILAGRELPTDDAGMMLVDLPKEEQPYPIYSAIDILTGDADESTIKGKAIIVAPTDMIAIERIPTGTAGEIPAYNFHAAVVQNLISGRSPVRLDLPIPIDLLLVLAIGAFGGLVLPKMSMLYRYIALVIVGFILANINFVLFNSLNTVMSVLYPAVTVLFFMAASPLVKSREPAAVAAPASKGFDLKKLLAGEPIAVQRADGKEVRLDEIPTRVLRDEKPSPELFQETIRLDFEALQKSSGLMPLGEQAAPEAGLDKPQAAALPAPEKMTTETSAPGTESAKPFIPDLLGVDMSRIPQFPDQTPKQPSEASSRTSRDEEMILTPEEKKKYGVRFSSEGQPVSFGRYIVIEPLGMGAMGTVYKGKDPAIDRLVALKTIRLDSIADPSEIGELKERLLREAKAAGNLSHPNIVTIYDYGVQGNLQYIAMEFVEGYTLETVLRRSLQLNYRIIASIIIQVCSALDYAHKMGIIHRDIKPANIMVMEGFRVKVMDFGIAHFKSSSMTQTGVAMGTPNYISPEQLKGKEVTPSSDIFSLGVVLYELLTHRKPFTGENISALVYKIVNVEPEPPSAIDPKIPPLFDLILKKALAKSPADRYRTAKELATALEDFTVALGKKPVRV